MIATRKIVTLAVVAAMVPCAPVLAQDPDVQAERRLKAMDADADGSVSLDEFTEFRRSWTSKRDNAAALMKPKVVRQAFDSIDGDKDSALSLAELVADSRAKASRKKG